MARPNQAQVRAALRLTTKVTVATAVVITLIVVGGFSTFSASVALLTIVYTIGDTFGSSIEIGVNRIAGSVIGCVIGALIYLTGVEIWLGTILAVALTLFGCAFLPMRLGYRLAAVLAGTVVLVPGDSVWQSVWQRVVATAIGVIGALVVDAFVFPAHTGQRVRALMADVLSQCRVGVDAQFATALTGQPNDRDIRPEVLPKFVDAQACITAVRYQPGIGSFESSDVYLLVANARAISAAVDTLKRSAVGLHQVVEAQHCESELRELLSLTNDAFDATVRALRAEEVIHLPDISGPADALRSRLVALTVDTRDVGRAFTFVFNVELIHTHLAWVNEHARPTMGNQWHVFAPRSA